MEIIIRFFAKRNYVYLYLTLVIVALLAFTYQALINVYLPYDDVYSMSLIKHSYVDILRITAHDVHPPLYYWLLKTYSLLAGSSLFALRFFSVLGVVAIILLGCFSIRQLFGTSTSLFFILLFILFPATQNMAVDIRMYSWTAFFVLACALYAFKFYGENTWSNGIGITLTALCAIYMHHYGLLAVAGIYFVLLASSIYRRQGIKRTVVSLCCVILLYLPWGVQLWQQILLVSDNYWIQALTWADFMLHAYYLYSPKLIDFPFVYFSKTQMVVAVGLVMFSQVTCLLFAAIHLYKKNRVRCKQIVVALALFLFPIVVGILFSLLAFPILAPRYMLCAFPLLVLALALAMKTIAEIKKVRYLLTLSCLLLLTLSVVRHKVCCETYKNEKRRNERIKQFTQSENDNIPLVTAKEMYFALAPLLYIAPDSQPLIAKEENEVIPRFDPYSFGTIDIAHTKDMQELVLVGYNSKKYETFFADFFIKHGDRYTKKDYMIAGNTLLLKIEKKQ